MVENEKNGGRGDDFQKWLCTLRRANSRAMYTHTHTSAHRGVGINSALTLTLMHTKYGVA